MGKVRWTERAADNIRAPHDYIAKDSGAYAMRFVKSPIKAASKLEDMPFCGRIVPELEGYGFRECLFQNYRIVYRVNAGADVEVLAVVHGAREMKSVFREDWEL
ncbi:MAG: type II toxin-antitoxin system RelE/ParE family toxin [Deltaproteobacteria bacterium]|nr:type II toxin-antitoxin system RelE/ParE family toxin [Deltaproteobacteria bacterium]